MTHGLFVYDRTTQRASATNSLFVKGSGNDARCKPAVAPARTAINHSPHLPETKLTRFRRNETLESTLRASETAWQHGCAKFAAPTKRRTLTSNARDKAAAWGNQPKQESTGRQGRET